MKDYIAGRGWQLDGSFASHRETCERCKLFTNDNPASLGKLCLAGAVLLKNETPTSPKERFEKPENWVGKAKAKKLMVYK